MNTNDHNLVYVCHPYTADPEGNKAKVAALCNQLVDEGLVPMAPQVYLSAFIDDDAGANRTRAMDLCKQLLLRCDAVYVYGDHLSEGMSEEIALAREFGVPILWVTQGPYDAE